MQCGEFFLLGGKKDVSFLIFYSYDIIIKESQFRGANSNFQAVDLFKQMRWLRL